MLLKTGFSNATALILGASQGLGLQFVNHLKDDNRFQHIWAACRHPESADQLQSLKTHGTVSPIRVDVTKEHDITECLAHIKQSTPKLHLVINCVGVLQDSAVGVSPERSIKELDMDQLLNYFRVNTIPSALLIKHLLPLLKHSDPSAFATISAKVGSITDNRIGGWYGYRSSKAALNMLLKTASVEYRRKSPNTSIIALHPGTVDTRLSKPFQKAVPKDKLFTPEFSVQKLLQVIDALPADAAKTGTFWSWDGTELPW
eukprot:TRINITY_DN66498_c6_g7_i1.p1 TRINITY_DN66498_c6_g7~~TRINITY_DN66498_c6_g7_i1.p1  ORF type:complete len:259 (+),score=25.35 TRINITY_DN66498_c6_g7_i1:25-801(+)